MAKFDKERFPSTYQNAVGMGARQLLHENSKELVKIIKENNVLSEKMYVFEIGAGGGRNLKYILDAYPDIEIGANDLFKKESFENMDIAVKNKILFFEKDTKELFDTENQNPNLVISSDHLMHLNYDKADFVLKGIMNKWKPEWILLRELKKEFETPEHPRLYHDYAQLLNQYNRIYESTSKQDSAYFIWLLKRK